MSISQLAHDQIEAISRINNEVADMLNDAMVFARSEILRTLHDEINALGGQPNNDYSRGVHETVAQALAIIEAKQAEVSHGT